jgi:hypothetical protein
MGTIYAEEDFLKLQLKKAQTKIDEQRVESAKLELEIAKLIEFIHQTRVAQGFIGFVTEKWGNLCCDCFDKENDKTPANELQLPLSKDVILKGTEFECHSCGHLIK